MYNVNRLNPKEFRGLRELNGTELPKMLPLLHMDDDKIRNPKFIFANKNNLHLFGMYLTEDMLDQWGKQIIADGSFQKKITWLDINDFIMPIHSHFLKSDIDDIHRLYPFLIEASKKSEYPLSYTGEIIRIIRIAVFDFIDKHLDKIQFSPKMINMLHENSRESKWLEKTTLEERQKYAEYIITPMIEKKFDMSISEVAIAQMRLDHAPDFQLPFNLEKEMIYLKPLEHIKKILPTWAPSNEIKKLDFFLNSIEYLKSDPLDFFKKYPKDMIIKIKEMTDSIEVLTNKSIESMSKDEIVKYLQLNEVSGLEFNL